MNDTLKWHGLALVVISVATLFANITSAINGFKIKQFEKRFNKSKLIISSNLIEENSEKIKTLSKNQKELLKVNKELAATTLKLQEMINKLAETDMQQMSGLTTEKVYVEMLRQYTDLLKITVELKKRIDLLEAK